jgi:tetratricopeptide (TPR) repeat protein
MKFKQFISFLLLALIGFNGIIFAEKWYNNYENAKRAVEEQNWSEAIMYLQEALIDKPEPSLEAKTTGLRFIKYTPYYYLGLAYYKQEKYKEAAAAFKKSQDFGVVKNIPELYSSLEKMASDCEKRLTPITQEQPSLKKPTDSKNAGLIDGYISDGESQFSDEKYSEALYAFNLAKGLIEKTGERVSELPSVKMKIEKIEQKIRTRSSLNRANKLSKDGKYQEAITEVKKIFEYDSGNTEARGLLELLENLQKNKFDSEKSRIVSEQQVQIIAGKEDFQKLIEDGKKLFLEGDYTKARAKLNAALQIKEGNPEVLKLLKTIDYSKSVDDINIAINHYFNGRIKECKSILTSSINTLSIMPEYKEKLITAYAFMAAALIDEHFLDGRTTKELLSEALQQIEKIYRIKPDFELDKEYFSPKVRFFFDRAKKKTSELFNDDFKRPVPKRPILQAIRRARLKNS